MKLYFENKYAPRKQGILAVDYIYDYKSIIDEDPNEYRYIILGINNPKDSYKYFKQDGDALVIPAGTELKFHHNDNYYSFYKMLGTPLILGFSDSDELEWLEKEREPKTNIAKVVKIMGWTIPPTYKNKVFNGWSCKWDGGSPWWLYLNGDNPERKNYYKDYLDSLDFRDPEDQIKGIDLLDKLQLKFEAEIKKKTGLDVKLKYIQKDLHSRVFSTRLFIPFE